MSEIESLLKNGQVSLNLGNPKEAMLYYDKVLSIDSKQIEALLKKGHILGKLARYEQAILFYDLVLKQDGGNLLALLNKGLAHHYLGNYDSAIRCYDVVLDVKPKNTTALYNKASSLIKSGKINDGLVMLSDVIKLDFSFKAKVKHDVDFQDLQHLQGFQTILK